MINFFKRNRDLQNKSREFLRSEASLVAQNNLHVMLSVTLFFTVILTVFWVASYTTFSAWNVTWVYRNSFFFYVVISGILFARFYGKERTLYEVNAACSFFQLLIIGFVGLVSIYPVEMNQPAVYFVPIVVGFCVAFTYTWAQSIIMIFIENAVYLLVAYQFKRPEVFSVDFFSCIMGAILAVFLSSVLLKNRIAEYEAREQFKFASMTDTLTGLFNKATSQEMVTTFMEDDSHKSCTYMIVDLDDFKKVNDTFGHMEGDKVLAAIGRILRHEAGEFGIAGRIGGDEFMVFLYDSEPGFGEEIAAKILRGTHQIKNPNGECVFSCSIGIFYTTDMTMNYDTMYAAADKALYRAKASGKNSFFSYDEQLYQML